MIYLIIFLFCVLVGQNYFLSRSFLYPPTLFCLVWLVSLVGILCSGNTLYPISAETLMVYFVGALSFSAGGMVFQVTGNSLISKPFSMSEKGTYRVHFLLDLLLLVVLIGLPVYWRSLVEIVDVSDPSLFFVIARQITVEIGGERQGVGVISNLVVLAMLLALAMHFENDGSWSRKWRDYLAVFIALIYGSLTGAKSNSVKLFLMLMFISFMREKKIRLKLVFGYLATIVVFFSVGLIAVNFAYEVHDSLWDTMHATVIGIQNYWLGSLVAFNAIVADPLIMESTQCLNRFFLETANHLGADYYVPILHADFSAISSSQESNTYTIYFSYFKDYGWFGVITGMMFLGGLTTWLYKATRSRSPVSVGIYSMFGTGLLLSIHAEHFVLGLNGYLKAVLFFLLIYHVLSRVNLKGSNRCFLQAK